ncbi:MAG: hypothetical protein IPO27_02975 [Bacteroidetes bacterium]|nr:hypothetical protein [Bacteroidota bacterium]
MMPFNSLRKTFLHVTYIVTVVFCFQFEIDAQNKLQTKLLIQDVSQAQQNMHKMMGTKTESIAGGENTNRRQMFNHYTSILYLFYAYF